MIQTRIHQTQKSTKKKERKKRDLQPAPLVLPPPPPPSHPVRPPPLHPGRPARRLLCCTRARTARRLDESRTDLLTLVLLKPKERIEMGMKVYLIVKKEKKGKEGYRDGRTNLGSDAVENLKPSVLWTSDVSSRFVLPQRISQVSTPISNV